MRYLTLGEVVTLHRAVVAATGGAEGIRDLGGLESALCQPKATIDHLRNAELPSNSFEPLQVKA